jgi:ketopantoate reductase
MNERIKELLNRSGGEFYEGFAGSTNFVKFAENDFEKFAELIVRECMEVASPNYMSTPEDSVYYVEQAINRIAKHFGVEND